MNYVITAALIGTALELVRLPELFVYGIRMCYTKDEGERLLVKKVLKMYLKGLALTGKAAWNI